MRIIHDLDPFLLRINGDVGLRWYSLPYLIGFLLAYRALIRAGERGELGGVTREAADRFLSYTVIGVLLGARFFHVFVFEFSDYGFDPLAWIAVWRGGLSFHGGLTGALLAIAVFARQEGISIYAVTDRLAVPVAIALGLGRIGNFINAEMWGTPYEGFLCVDYTQSTHLANPPQGCRHPTQLYEMAKNFGIAGLLAYLGRRPLPPGLITWLFVGLYGAIRFMLMFVRDEVTVWQGLTLSQIFSGLMALAAVLVLALMGARLGAWRGARAG
ncbi:MAG: prolipoprotein diacylglyceryl transferase [Gemmatimonadota bacterium]